MPFGTSQKILPSESRVLNQEPQRLFFYALGELARI